MDYKEKVIALLNSQELSKEQKEKLEDIFPELKESEDERIKEEIISFVEQAIDAGYGIIDKERKDKWIAWLEKQSEQKHQYKSRPRYIGEEELLGEQKPDDKVETKFYEGDWIIYDGWTMQIKEVYEDGYSIINQGFIPKEREEEMRLWTIQDAKSGDILVDDLGNICIYQEPSTNFMYHSFCYGNHKCFIDGGGSHKIVGTYPTTKEQRDTLMKAMADAGYTFDFEKKELKKIENEIEIPFGANDSELQEATYYIPKFFHAEIDGDKVVIKKGEKPTGWSEEDEYCAHQLIVFCENCMQPDSGAIRCANWLKSLKERYTWEPSDEQMEFLWKYAEQNNYDGTILGTLYNDLKKLREK